MLAVAEILVLLAVYALSWVAACHALLTKHDPRSALGWTVTVLFLPLVGAVLYACFGISRAESRASRIMRRQARLEPPYAHPPFERIPPEKLPENILCTEHIGRVLSRQHVCGGNDLRPLRNGDEAYPAMLQAIDAAREYVFLSTYIFNAGRAAGAFAQSLARAASRGADVRLLVDGVGMLYSRHKPWKKLERHGVRTAVFLPLRLFPPQVGINLRNHRKILVCDGTGFTGGMNIADDNLSAGRDLRVQDMHFQCRGPVVDQLRRAFLLDWGFCTGEYTPLPPATALPQGASRCRVIMDGPGAGGNTLEDIYCGVINSARKCIRVMTPYFLPSHALVAALRSAAHRGVDVRVILPEKNNLIYVHWAQFRILPVLLDAGVRVWLQPAPFAHSKLLAVDGHYSQIGSANLDGRSLRLNFELNMEVFGASFHDILAAHMDHAVSVGREVTSIDLARQNLAVRLRNAGCWIFSPYL